MSDMSTQEVECSDELNCSSSTTNKSVKDDSFDAEFNLLESTLTDLKGNEPQIHEDYESEKPGVSDGERLETCNVNFSLKCGKNDESVTKQADVIKSLKSCSLLVPKDASSIAVSEDFTSNEFLEPIKSNSVTFVSQTSTDSSNISMLVTECDHKHLNSKPYSEINPVTNASDFLKPTGSSNSTDILKVVEGSDSNTSGFDIKSCNESEKNKNNCFGENCDLIEKKTSIPADNHSIHTEITNDGSNCIVREAVEGTISQKCTKDSDIKLKEGNVECAKNYDKGFTPVVTRPTKKSNLFCSTPVAVVEMDKEISNDKENKCEVISHSDIKSFGLISPLTTSLTESSSKMMLNSRTGKMNLKRKNLNLECIEEGNEGLSDECPEKKTKVDVLGVHKENDGPYEDVDLSSSVPCFEAPAKSILKKWQPSGLTRNSASTTFLVLDECGESDTEESNKPSQDAAESNVTDEFENECKSLNEELLKGSYNIETLEKYHSQVMLESQMDDEKFDELLQELNFEINEKTSYSIKPMEESVLSEKAPFDINPTDDNLKERNSIETTSNNTKMTANNTDSNSSPMLSSVPDKDLEKSLSDDIKNTQTKDGKYDSTKGSSSEQTSPLHVDDVNKPMDEEDFLLEGELNTEKKPYVFFEFVSSDPKENEDNYNPEWQKLGRLTSDEERYRAVRDRWRSLVPPDPNRDLTCRQWRKRNNKPPLRIPSLNNNHQIEDDGDRNQPCTAVFERKIARMVEDLEYCRTNILKQREIDFQNLAIEQDREQRTLLMRGGTEYDLQTLHNLQIQQCRDLKEQHDLELSKINNITNEKVQILKAASNEVFLFQQFYKGVGAAGDKVSLFMTNMQVEELMETEEMLEQYSKFYQ